MKKRIFTGLGALLAIFLAGSVIAAVYITRTTRHMDQLVLLHQVEIDREHLIIQLLQAQATLYRGRLQRSVDVDLLVAQVQEVGKTMNSCLRCHHAPELTQVLQRVQGLINDYQGAVSRIVAASANLRRVTALESQVLNLGREIISQTQGLALTANTRLRQRTQETLDAMHRIRRVLYVMLGLGLVLALLIAAGLAQAVDRPLSRLVEATRRIARGELRHRIDPAAVPGAEFRELAQALNTMTAELHRSQRQLIQSAKLAGIGELASNIAYEVNNPLTAVLGYTGVLLKAEGIPDEKKEHLRIIEHEALRAREIIKNLLDFSRRRPPEPVTTDIKNVVEDALALVKTQARLASVAIALECAGEVPSVSIDPDEMRQVFVNLMNNALFAMSGGGTLTIRCLHQQEGGERGARVAVEVADNGIGIPEAHLDRIFDPFFTTRTEGAGSGLGLSLSYQIVQNHGGRIEVESAVGKGSLFRVVLPAA